MKTEVLTGLNVRLWYVEGGVHPVRSPQLLAMGKFGDPSKKIGDDKKISAPDPNNFNTDITVGKIKGARERASLSVSVRSTIQASILLGWVNRGCRVDLFALVGKCGNPSDFDEGGEKWVYFPDGGPSGHAWEGFGAFGADENKEVNDKVDFTSEDYWEFMQMTEEQIGAAVTVRQIYTVDVYLGNACENCPDPTDRILATMAGASATPGTQPSLLYTLDGGINWLTQIITTLYSNEDIADGEVIGGDIVYVSNTANSIHWTDGDLLYDGTNTWLEVTNGFVKNKGPRAIWDADVRHTWIVGDGGYIYFAQNYKVGVVVQDAGVVTTQGYNAVHAYDTLNVIAVGNSNAMAYTRNGGISWQAVIGPSVGINLGTCWMWDATTWFVGEGSGGSGKLWLTTDSGKSWNQVGLPSAYNRIDKIRFVSEAEGYLSARAGGMSYILRTITAGNAWTVLPQGKRGVPVPNSALLDLAVCSKYSNMVYAGGISASGSAGIIVRCA